MSRQPLNFVELDAATAAANAYPPLGAPRFRPGDVVSLEKWDRYQRRDHDESIYPYDPFGECTVISWRHACCESDVLVRVVNDRRREIELDQNWMDPVIEI